MGDQPIGEVATMSTANQTEVKTKTEQNDRSQNKNKHTQTGSVTVTNQKVWDSSPSTAKVATVNPLCSRG